jgi:predicted nucleic acid-binding protein
MVVFFDTSVLVASASDAHSHFGPASAAAARVAAGKDVGWISQHSIAEVYAVLTRLPVVPRIHPLEAATIIRDNILKNFEVVAIDKKDYWSAVHLVSQSGWAGGKIYDALLLRCAEKCQARKIYTFNLRDFQQMAPGHLQNKISAP